MKPVLTPSEAAELDRATQARGVAGATLMERAGWATARAAADVLGGTYGRRAAIVCGKGNNGGDGLVAARHLSRWGARVEVVCLQDPASLRDPSLTNHRRLVTETDAVVRGAGLSRAVGRADVVIDAIFGTGFRGTPEGLWAEAIESVNAAPVPVVAVDIPSGVDGGTGGVAGAAVRADLTVTFGAAKVGVVLLPGAELAGDVRVVDIGFPDDLIGLATGLTEPGDVVAAVPDREVDAHKKASGTLVVVAGSRSMPGAARLIARAAGRAGAGYVFVAAPASALPAMQAGATEVVWICLPETPEGTVGAAALDVLHAHAAEADALAIGPGLTTNDETQEVVRALVRDAPVPLVLDADGLNAFEGRLPALAEHEADVVLTPHLGELARLRGPGAGADDRLTAARELAARARAVALVKGTRTTIADPSGRARINLTGTPVLATAGTGDVLTGTIGGLLARGMDPFDAAWAGAYVHGLAGILAGRDLGTGAVAGDVVERLPEAFAVVEGQS